MTDTPRPPTITRNGVVRLLVLAAAADQRTVADEDVTLWLGVAQEQRWSEASAQRAILEHYASGADRPRVTPAAITDRLRVLRGKAAESFDAPRIPDGLPASDYPRWLRARLAEHVDAALAQWAATGEPVPTAKTIEPSRFRSVEQAAAGLLAIGDGRRQAIESAAEHFAQRPPVEPPRPRVPARRRGHDPAGRADADAELADLRAQADLSGTEVTR